MDARALLDRLSAAGLTVTANADGDRLRIQPEAKLTPDLRAAALAMKGDLLALLAAPGAAMPTPPPAEQAPAPAAAATAACAPQEAKPLMPSASERARQRQRQRRAARPRIDYYPSPDAAKALASLRQQSSNGNASSIINNLLIGAGATSPETRA